MGPGQASSPDRTKICPQCKTRYDGESKICPKDGTILVFEAANELQIGAIIDAKYQVAEYIGRGASGSVYRAYQASLKRDVAIKVLKLTFVSDNESMKRFELEAQATSKLIHHNICGVYDHGRLPNGQPYMICEYLKGKTLKDVLQKHKLFQPADAVEICVQICDALTAAHQQGVVHRDIKPANIMLCVDARGHAIVKLIDFGMAKILRGQRGEDESLGLTQTGDILGTPYYMSPQQAMGQKVDWRADIYSLGCVLFEMVSGSVPYHGKTEFEVIDKHVNSPVPSLPPHIAGSEQIALVIKRSMSKSPDERYASASEMKEALLGRDGSQSPRSSGSGIRKAVDQRTSGATRKVSDTRNAVDTNNKTAQPRKLTAQQLVPLLLLLLLAVVGWFVFSNFNSWFGPKAQVFPAARTTTTDAQPSPDPANPAVTAADPTTPVGTETSASSAMAAGTIGEEKFVPEALAPIKSMASIDDQITFCENFLSTHPHDFGTEHQLALLYANLNERKSAEHLNAALKLSCNDEHLQQHLVGSETEFTASVAKVYLKKQLSQCENLPFLKAACLIKLAEIEAAEHNVVGARAHYEQVANDRNEEVAEYAAVAKKRLNALQAETK